MTEVEDDLCFVLVVVLEDFASEIIGAPNNNTEIKITNIFFMAFYIGNKRFSLSFIPSLVGL